LDAGSTSIHILRNLLLAVCGRAREFLLLHLHVENLVEQRLQPRLRTVRRHARLEPPERLHEAAAPVVQGIEVIGRDLLLHHHGNANLPRVTGLEAIEAGLAHADNRERISIQ
jgi:hypothetical protein